MKTLSRRAAAASLLVALLGTAVGCSGSDDRPVVTRSPDGRYTVALQGLKGRARIPLLNHEVTAAVTRPDGTRLSVALSDEDLFDQPFETQFTSTVWITPNILQFRGSQTEPGLGEQLVLENQSDRVLGCVRVRSVTNYDVILAFDLPPRTQQVVPWNPGRPDALTAYLMVSNCETFVPAGLLTTQNFPRAANTRHVYSVSFQSNGTFRMDVKPLSFVR